MRPALALVCALTACARDLPDDQACTEVGYSIAARAEQCTGDAALGESLYEAYEAQTTCALDAIPADSPLANDQLLTYECALVTRNLACELASEYGDDLAAWLGSSPSCGVILEGP